MKALRTLFVVALLGLAALVAFHIYQQFNQIKLLNKVITRLTADSRVAEVIVTNVAKDPNTSAEKTTIKFLEYDTAGQPLPPKYFTFTGNIIQFQSLVIRFDDKFVKYGDALRGKSIYLFLKAFSLKDKDTEVFDINPVNHVPAGYEVPGIDSSYQQKLWREFWHYALNENDSGIKNAQLEAPGTKFIPGLVYTLKIEHDGGLRIDASKIPTVLAGEKL